MKRSVLAVIASLAGAASAMGDTVWGVWNNAPGSQSIVTFDSATPGVFNLVGPTGIVNTAAFINSLDFGPGGSNLYLATNAAQGFLHDVSMATGLATNPRGGGLASGDSINDLSWDHFNARMLGIGASGVTGTGARLYQIDLVTGNATNLGTIVGLDDHFAISLAVRPSDGVIFAHGIATDQWFSINPNTLTATALGPIGSNTNFGQGASFNPADGVLYHAMFTASLTSPFASIDQTTGVPTIIGNLGAGAWNQVGDIAFIPAPGSLALLGLGGLLAARRRRA